MSTLRTNISTGTVQKRYQYEVSSFGGVDYSNSKLNVSGMHSTDMANFIKKNHIVQKRSGCFMVSEGIENKIIHNIFYFEDSNNKGHYIANIGGSLYEINYDYSFTLLKENCVLNRKISAFPSNNRLYILGGIKYLMILANENKQLEVIEVSNSEYAYVPTTTMGITSSDSGYSARQSLDSVNLLTYWRKNALITGLTQDENNKVITDSILEYQLDTPISFKDKSEYSNIELELTFYDDENTQFSTDKSSVMKTITLNVALAKGINLKGIDDKHTTDEIITDNTLGGILVLVHYGSNDFNDTFITQLKENVICFDNQGGVATSVPFKVFGYINLSGSIVLFNDYQNPNQTNNLIITFPTYNNEVNNINYIDKCFIGVVYNSNNINSLFVSGNDLYPARDWHSEELNTSQLNSEESKRLNEKDLVYFPDTSYCDYGEDNKSPILAYDVLGTGDLLVLKKYTTYEPTIYFRTGQLVAVRSSTGEYMADLMGSQLYRPEYSLTTGNIGKSVMDYGKIVNFNGDTLFIGNDKTIQGLDKETKSYDNQRYSNTRSDLIDEYLKKLDFSKAQLFTDSEYLYLIINNEMFVSKYGDNYEYYHEKYNTNIIDIFNLFNSLYFSDDKGRLFLLNNQNSYVDSEFITSESGDILSSVGTSKIILNQNLINKLDKADEIEFTNVYAREYLGMMTTDFNIQNTKIIFLNITLINKVGSHQLVQLNNKCFELNKTSYNEYELTEIDLSNFDIVYDTNNDENKLFLLKNKFIVKKINHTDSFILVNNFVFNDAVSPIGRINYGYNVEAHYTTIPILFGSSYMAYYKNIYSIMLTNDTGLPSETNVDLLDNDLREPLALQSSSQGLNYSNLNYNSYDLEKELIPVRNDIIRTNILKREYIVLNFYNNNPTNIILSKTLFTFSIGGVII